MTMKTSLNRRTSTTFAAFRPSACAWNPMPSTAVSKDFKAGVTANVQCLCLDLDLDRLNGRRPHGANEWPMARRGIA